MKVYVIHRIDRSPDGVFSTYSKAIDAIDAIQAKEGNTAFGYPNAEQDDIFEYTLDELMNP